MRRGNAPVLLFLAVIAGCQSTPSQPAAVRAPSAVTTHSEMIQSTKSAFLRGVSSFYRDEWEQVLAAADEMALLGQRWQEQAAPEGRDASFLNATAGYAEGVRSLTSAAKSESVKETTEAFRVIASNIAQLETIEK
jgi:hypothetical protein